jgi:hypothetical protein
MVGLGNTLLVGLYLGVSELPRCGSYAFHLDIVGRIGTACPFAMGHLLGIGQCGLHGVVCKVFQGCWSRCYAMTMILGDNLREDLRLNSLCSLCGLPLWLCTLGTVMFHDDRQGSVTVLGRFPANNRPNYLLN